MIGSKVIQRGDSFVIRRYFHQSHAPGASSRRNGQITLIRIDEIEHACEGCACHQGFLARTLLKGLPPAHGDWILIDTDSGIKRTFFIRQRHGSWLHAVIT